MSTLVFAQKNHSSSFHVTTKHDFTINLLKQSLGIMTQYKIENLVYTNSVLFVNFKTASTKEAFV